MPFDQSKWRQYMLLLGRAAAAVPALLATCVASVRQRPSVKAADDRGRSRAYAWDWPVMVLDVVRRRTEVAWLHFRRLAESGCSCGGRYVHW
jgi:hypothetical protein